MKRLLAVIAVLLMVAASCGSDSDDSAAADEASDAAPEPAEEPAAEAEETAAEGTAADLAITEVVFGDHVTITNTGDGMVNIDEVWLCNRPAYVPVAVSLAPGESQTIAADTLGGLSADGGEAALYTSNAFDDSAAIIDYVNWGGGGGRESVATEAGIWSEGDSVDGGGTGIAAAAGGDASEDWTAE